MNDELIGKRVTILSDKGAYHGGIFKGEARNGDLFLMADEVCLSGELDGHWHRLRKPELQRIQGQVVGDPRR